MKNISIWILKRFVFILAIQSLTLFFYISFFGFHSYSKEKTFTNGKRDIILLGMYHIGTKEYYKNIETRYVDKKNLLVLLEGIKNRYISKDLVQVDHSSSAMILGLESQQKNLFKNYKSVNSDTYFDDMDSGVTDYLNNVFEIWEYIAVLDFNNAKKQMNLLSENKIDKDFVFNEIINKRNNIVISNIKKYQAENLLIPWGALHHSEIEDYLLSNGYEVKETNYIKNFNVVEMIIFSIAFFTR